MTNDDVIYRHRLRVLSLAAECGSVAGACRIAGIHRSTFYRWKAQVEPFGLEILRPRECRRPQMPNSVPVLIEQRMVAFALGHPGYGPAHIASELPRPKWGGFTIFSQRRLARPAQARHRPPSAQVRPAGRPCRPARAGP
jgi:hypothetical protein